MDLCLGGPIEHAPDRKQENDRQLRHSLSSTRQALASMLSSAWAKWSWVGAWMQHAGYRLPASGLVLNIVKEIHCLDQQSPNSGLLCTGNSHPLLRSSDCSVSQRLHFVTNWRQCLCPAACCTDFWDARTYTQIPRASLPPDQLENGVAVRQNDLRCLGWGRNSLRTKSGPRAVVWRPLVLTKTRVN